MGDAERRTHCERRNGVRHPLGGSTAPAMARSGRECDASIGWGTRPRQEAECSLQTAI